MQEGYSTQLLLPDYKEVPQAILMLDIDGVINLVSVDGAYEKREAELATFFKQHKMSQSDQLLYRICLLDDDILRRIAALCEKCNAKIVLSSSWRSGQSVEWFAQNFKIIGPYIIGKTPDRGFMREQDFGGRCGEIATWISLYGAKQLCVLDDVDKPFLNCHHPVEYSLRDVFGKHFVQCDTPTGFTKACEELALKALTSKLEIPFPKVESDEFFDQLAKYAFA
jgi:hypothetical protein